MDTTTPKEQGQRPHRDNRMIVGIIIIVVGTLILLDRLDFFLFPQWLLSWPVILIVVGFLVGAKQRFTGIGWFILIFLGTFFFAKEHIPFAWGIEPYMWPIAIILVGVLILYRGTTSRENPGMHRHRHHNPYRHVRGDAEPSLHGDASKGPEPQTPSDGNAARASNGEDMVDLTAIFGSIKRRIFSKNFRFADVTTIFGGVELDLTQADINGRATIDVTQFFGGTTLIVPANWSVESDLVAIMGGINDKRSAVASSALDKVLVISGTAIFAGIEIKSYA